MNIANLPPNPYQDQDEIKLQSVNNPKLNVVVYTEKSLVVYGEATRTYKNDLKNLGGKYNGKLKPREGFEGGPGWIFFSKSRDKVIQFVNQVNTSEVESNEEIPTVVAPVKSSTFQWVKWKVFRPSEGMNLTIKVEGNPIEGKVLQTESHEGNIVDTVYVDIGGKTSKLVICNGSWQVWGYMKDHTIFFSNPGSPNQKKERDYSDIASI